MQVINLPSLSSQEEGILAALLDPEAIIEVVIPEKQEPTLLIGQLEVACKACGYMERKQSRLRSIIGRILLIISANPDIYRSQGYPSYEAFLREVVYEKFGLTRTLTYEAKKMATSFPTLPLNDIEEIGVSRMNLVSRFTSEQEPSSSKYIAKAKELSLKDLREWATNEKLIEKGEDEVEAIVIYVSKPVAQQWRDFSKARSVQAWVQSSSPGVIFEAMMAEVSGPWMSQGEERNYEQTNSVANRPSINL